MTTSPKFEPQTRIARIKSYFLEDDAVSLNGRKYPTEAVDRLIQSAQVQLSDPHALPLTCYLSHDHADRDSTRDIVGKITSVGREGKKAYAYIDIPDTVAGRDTATLVKGGYIRSQSLRASGAELRLSKEHAFPLVGGAALKLEGIDFTTSPGLPQIARIADIQESHEPQTIDETFHTSPAHVLLLEELEVQKEVQPMEVKLKEENIAPITGGTTVGVTDGDPRGDYSKRTYLMPPGTDPDTYPEALADLIDVHDRLSFIIGLECSPTTMEARRRFGEDVIREAKEYQVLQEHGAKFAAKTKQHILKAHDGVAKHLGMECSDASSNSSSAPSNDDMQDSDDDDAKPSERAKLTKQYIEKILREPGYMKQSDLSKPALYKAALKETKKPMTPEEAARLLAEAGYKIEAPKTKEQLLQEQIDTQKRLLEEQKQQFAAQLAEQQQQLASEQQKQFDELKKLLEQKQNSPFAATAVRKSLVEGATAQEPSKRPYYRQGDYLKEQLRSIDRTELLDRSRPLPEWMNLERALGEFQIEYLGLFDAIYGLTPDGPARFLQ